MKKVLSIPSNFVGACLVALILLASPATAQVLFEDNFSKPNRTAEKWSFLQGAWDVQNGALQQGQADGRTIAVISDDFWDDTWNEYIFEVTARKLRGSNGVRIFWRIKDDLQPGPGRDDARSFTLGGPVKGRLADEKSRIKFWWEIGWKNSESFVIRDVRGITDIKKGTETKHKLGRDDLHVKILNQGLFLQLFLNDELIFEGKDINGSKGGRVGVGTEGTTAVFDNVFVTGLKGRSVEPDGKLTTSWGLVKTR